MKGFPFFATKIIIKGTFSRKSNNNVTKGTIFFPMYLCVMCIIPLFRCNFLHALSLGCCGWRRFLLSALCVRLLPHIFESHYLFPTFPVFEKVRETLQQPYRGAVWGDGIHFQCSEGINPQLFCPMPCGGSCVPKLHLAKCEVVYTLQRGSKTPFIIIANLKKKKKLRMLKRKSNDENGIHWEDKISWLKRLEASSQLHQFSEGCWKFQEPLALVYVASALCPQEGRRHVITHTHSSTRNVAQL